MPVEPASLAAFTAAVMAAVISPGPDTLIILRYTLASGRRVGLATLAGVQLGLVVHTAAASTGLSLVIVSVPALYGALAVAGACYLGWLGWQSIRAGVVAFAAEDDFAVGAVKGMRDAALTNILNPKVIFLFLALMPSFVSPERGRLAWQFTTLAAALIVVNTIWQGALVLTAEAARDRLAQPHIQRTLSWTTGVILIALAIALIVERLTRFPEAPAVG